jgi:tetratricopeptide (TPR) repeat protein
VKSHNNGNRVKKSKGSKTNLSGAPPQCEVIMLTALQVECQAVLHHLQQRGEDIVHPSGTVYHWGTFLGKTRLWHVAVAEIGVGGVSAALEAEKAIQFFQANIALFVGIAGGLKDVQLGDVVAATKIYAYEAGKEGQSFEPRLELGRSSHALEQRARAEAHSDEWLSRLDGSRLDPAPRVLIGALAAGAKVLASTQSSLSDLLKNTYSDALAVEMEGHGFLHAVSINRKVHGLVIRGISDLLDDKLVADTAGWQHIAAQHAAVFAFQILATYTLSSDYELSGINSSSWLNAPFARNPFFTSREGELQELYARFWQLESASIGHTTVISGLGGIGKTQLAVEYAYRYDEEYSCMLWARAESMEALTSSVTEIAHLLDLPEKDAQEQEITIQAVKRWLQQQGGWLLILDNADTPGLLSRFLPPTVGGHLLITTRAADWSAEIPSLTHPLEVGTFSEEQGAIFLLRRSGLLAAEATLAQTEMHVQRLAMKISHELGGLPLALDQAGAYLQATSSSLDTYWGIYRQRSTQLLTERRGAEHPESVAATWIISIQNVEQQNPVAADLLRLCAFLAPGIIPEEIITKGASTLDHVLAVAASDPYLLDQAIAALRASSLIARDQQTRTLIIHRLVQAILRDSMPAETQQQWMLYAIYAVEAACPALDFANWPILERLLPHVLICVTWIEHAPCAAPAAVFLLNQAGRYLDDCARYEEARRLYRRALRISEQKLGARHPSLIKTLNGLASLYHTQGKYRKAEELYQRALSICEQVLGSEHPDTASNLNNLASLYHTQKKYEQAEWLYQRALSIYKQVLGPKHPNTANSLNNLASLYHTQGKYEQAEALYLHVLAIREQELGARHPSTANSLNDLAELYRAQGKYREAERLYQRALSIRKQVVGSKHPSTASSLNNLASLYYTQGRYGEAERLYQHALSICEQVLGAKHPSTADSLNNLAELYRAQGKYREAERLYQRVLSIREQLFGARHLSTANSLNNLAELCQVQGKYEQAEELYQRVLAIRVQKLGATHPSTTSSLNNLAELYQAQGKYGEAERLYQRALSICEQELGITHLFTATSLNNLAIFYYTRRKYRKAERLYRRALSIYEQQLGKEHPHTYIVRKNYATLLEAMNSEKEQRL